MSSGLQRRSVVVNGLTLSYVEREPVAVSDEAPILLLHGLIATGEAYSALIAELPKNRRIIALDSPGGGFSERNMQADVSFAGMAKSVTTFMQQLGLVRPVLLGHSHGGAVSLRLAVERPELLRGLILLAPANPFSGQEKLVLAFYLSWFGRRFARLVPKMPAWMHKIGFLHMTGPGAKCDPATLELYRQSGKVPGTLEHTLRLLETWQADMDELRVLLEKRQIELPALLLWGDRDRVVPERSGFQLQRCFTHPEHVTLRGVGHLPNEEKPKDCGALIRTWLIWIDTLPKYAYARGNQTATKQPA